MIKFEFEVKDEIMGSLNGEIEAETEQEAREELVEFYAMELGTMASDIDLTLTQIN